MPEQGAVLQWKGNREKGGPWPVEALRHIFSLSSLRPKKEKAAWIECSMAKWEHLSPTLVKVIDVQLE